MLPCSYVRRCKLLQISCWNSPFNSVPDSSFESVGALAFSNTVLVTPACAETEQFDDPYKNANFHAFTTIKCVNGLHRLIREIKNMEVGLKGRSSPLSLGRRLGSRHFPPLYFRGDARDPGGRNPLVVFVPRHPDTGTPPSVSVRKRTLLQLAQHCVSDKILGASCHCCF